MIYCIFGYIGFTILSITLRYLGLGIKNWEFWLILLLSVGDNVPESILLDFDELVLPLFLEEGFKVEEYIAPRYGYEDDGWRISWDLKEGEVQYE